MSMLIQMLDLTYPPHPQRDQVSDHIYLQGVLHDMYYMRIHPHMHPLILSQLLVLLATRLDLLLHMIPCSNDDGDYNSHVVDDDDDGDIE